MNRSRQFGQSMTEYLVVLGVTGAALLAATGDVTRLFDNVERSYATQSSEMNKVQLYNSHKVRFNSNPDGKEDFDDGDTPPTDNTPQPEPEQQLPTVEWVYDASGKPLGQLDGNALVDEDGNAIAWCQRTATGDCVFVDENGNIIYGGATTDRQWVDENGNELPLIALTRSGKVYGFAYLYKNKYYSAADKKLLDPQPTGLTPKPMRKVLELANGVPQATGYELDGKLYSINQTMVLKPDFSEVQDTEKAELVNVLFASMPNSNWEGYKPCLVLPSGWNDLLSDGAPLTGAWENKFNNPADRISLAGRSAASGFINASASECGGASTVTLDPASGKWVLSK